jgi:hypothetical protein
MFSISKLKRAKNSNGDRQIFQAAPQLLENILEYTKENKTISKLILIYTVLNEK